MHKILFLLFLIFFSCTGKVSSSTENKHEQKTELQTSTELILQQKITELKKSMLAYLEDGQSSYSRNDVDKCILILEKYLGEISKTTNKADAMEIVENTVHQLNDLNNNAKSKLIETDERERIADIIISATYAKGYNSMDDDITEEWREW